MNRYVSADGEAQAWTRYTGRLAGVHLLLRRHLLPLQHLLPLRLRHLHVPCNVSQAGANNIPVADDGCTTVDSDVDLGHVPSVFSVWS